MTVERTCQLNIKRAVKRLYDFVLSGALLIFLLPLMLCVALSVWLLLGRPILFRQTRTGLAGAYFTILKFRSMREPSSSAAYEADEIRLTKFGKLLRRSSLDELPELINVLKGEMSLVGPRPLLPEYLPRYDAFQFRRHEVRPGLTGWAQINGRNAISWEEKFILDVWYVDNWSLTLDSKILVTTLLKVLRREGISKGGHVTMPQFQGSSAQRPSIHQSDLSTGYSDLPPARKS